MNVFISRYFLSFIRFFKLINLLTYGNFLLFNLPQILVHLLLSLLFAVLLLVFMLMIALFPTMLQFSGTLFQKNSVSQLLTQLILLALILSWHFLLLNFILNLRLSFSHILTLRSLLHLSGLISWFLT